MVKGPTEKFMRAAGVEPSTDGVLSLYDGLLDGVVVDVVDEEPAGAVTARSLPTLMSARETRRSVATAVLELAASLRGERPE